MSSDVTIIILAAGLGTRMRSKHAKVLHQAGGMPLVEHVVRTALTQAAPERVVVVVGHQAERVQQSLAGYHLCFATQLEQKGTGHAVHCSHAAVADRSGLTVILYGDCPLLSPATLARLIEHQRASTAGATVITTLLPDPTGYGRILRDSNGNVAGIVEQKAATADQKQIREINSGVYCFRSELLWSSVQRLEPNPASGEVYLTDVVELLGRDGWAVQPMVLGDANEILGINTRLDLAEVDRILRERKSRELMLQGVTIERPETVTIDADVQVGADSVIGAFAQLRGRTLVGEDCVIGSSAILQDAELGDSVQILPFTMVNQSRVGAGAHIGPYARLRLDNEVAPNAHIGNFVELKKTSFGAGSKAMHLAYLGDSRIGEGVNIGAGTITCNYDGVRKHETQIGDGAFVGSNTTLVAPVVAEPGSYVAAGSVITHTVPAGALAFGRARQTVKEGWVARNRPAKARSNAPTA